MDSQTAYSTADATPALANRPWWQLAVLAGVLAAVTNLVVFVLVDVVGGLNLRVPASPGSTTLTDLGPGLVALMSAVPAVIAALLAAALARWTGSPRRWFGAIAVIALVASLVTPLGIAGVGAGVKATLIAMHVVAAVAIVAVLAARLPAGRAAGQHG